ncbi:hypothetical protein MCOR13_006767 [Pyricularia oryzae]|nr:hypothetical protein MCOR13_006767 [Pyricularia oryzae]
MEAGDSVPRQSAHLSASNNHSDYYSQRSREPLNRPPLRQTPSTMATAALISPSNHYSHHSPYASAYTSHPNSASSAHPPPPPPTMVSPVDSARRSDDNETPHRQSLPSIRDIIGKSSDGPPGANSLPSPFSTHSSAPPPPPPRSYNDQPQTREKPPSPRQPERTATYSRPEPLPPFQDSSRGPPPRPGVPSLSIFAGGNPPKPNLPEISERRHHPGPPPPPPAMESQSAGQYAHHAPPPAHGPPQAPPPPPSSHSHMPPPLSAPTPPYSSGSAPLPPGQLPLSAYPISPRNPAPSMTSPYNTQRPPMGPEEAEYAARNQLKYNGPPGRPYESWSFAESLAKVGGSAHVLLSFADRYAQIAQDEPVPSRMPSDAEISDMVANCEHVMIALDALRNQRMYLSNELHREGAPRPSRGYGGEDEDVNMYNDGMKQSYNVMETKKRRGRAAPPGRCHSCNRMDTPEWRRGPDGARTLCNACGLHYAKLERKKQMERGQARKDAAK